MYACRFKLLALDAKGPYQALVTDAGYDLFTHKIEDCGEFIKVYTGIAIEPPPGIFFLLVPRSSAHKRGLTLYNNVGIIDNLYRGEIIGLMLKTSTYLEPPEVGSRLLQLVPQVQPTLYWQEKEELSDTVRGIGGFGHSGA
jgi:dUTP pyrophosphatase